MRTYDGDLAQRHRLSQPHVVADARLSTSSMEHLLALEEHQDAEIGPLLDQVAVSVPSFTGDDAYDQEGVCTAIAERYPEAAIIVPSRSTAVPSAAAETEPTQRDRHLQIAEHGRAAWQKASGYTKRARVKAARGRFKQGSVADYAVHGPAAVTRGGRRRPYPEPNARPWTPDLCPRRLTPNGSEVTAPRRSPIWP